MLCVKHCELHPVMARPLCLWVLPSPGSCDAAEGWLQVAISALQLVEGLRSFPRSSSVVFTEPLGTEMLIYCLLVMQYDCAHV